MKLRNITENGLVVANPHKILSGLKSIIQPHPRRRQRHARKKSPLQSIPGTQNKNRHHNDDCAFEYDDNYDERY